MQAGQNFFTCVQQRAPPVPSSMAAPIPQFSMGGDTSAFSRVSSGQVPPEALPVHDLGFCSHSAGAPHTMVFTACLQKVPLLCPPQHQRQRACPWVSSLRLSPRLCVQSWTREARPQIQGPR